MCQTRQTTETPLWITPEERCPRGPVALYTTFRAEGACAGAMLEITGLGMFRAYLNGVRVGEDYLTPGCNDYDAYIRVFTYPVGALLRAGEDNLLTVWLGDGWYRALRYRQGRSVRRVRLGRPVPAVGAVVFSGRLRQRAGTGCHDDRRDALAGAHHSADLHLRL